MTDTYTDLIGYTQTALGVTVTVTGPSLAAGYVDCDVLVDGVKVGETCRVAAQLRATRAAS